MEPRLPKCPVSGHGGAREVRNGQAFEDPQYAKALSVLFSLISRHYIAKVATRQVVGYNIASAFLDEVLRSYDFTRHGLLATLDFHRPTDFKRSSTRAQD
jgi:hypothetical protein